VKTKYLIVYVTKSTNRPILWISVVVVYTYLNSSELWFWRKTEINWTNRVKNEEVLRSVNKERIILHQRKWKNADFIGDVLRSKCLITCVTEWKIKGTGRRSSRSKQLLDDLKVSWRFYNLKGKALFRSLWRTYFGRGYALGARLTT
jgi:hypothetical protein